MSKEIIKCYEDFTIDHGPEPTYGNGCSCRQEFMCERPKYHKGNHRETTKDSDGNPIVVMWKKIPSDSKKLKLCAGCDNNFYNGNNDLDIKGCWSLASSKIVFKKKVHVDQAPPWNQEPIEVLSCYHQKRYVFVGKDQTY